MKRLWFGVGFLVVILVIGIALTAAFDRIHSPIADSLRQASQSALDQDWEKATALAKKARAEWKEYRDLIAAVADHEPLEEMENLLEQLDVYAQRRRTADFAAACIELAIMADAMLESQQITWWNFLSVQNLGRRVPMYPVRSESR